LDIWKTLEKFIKGNLWKFFLKNWNFFGKIWIFFGNIWGKMRTNWKKLEDLSLKVFLGFFLENS
jgi:hypothetical protein